MKLELDRETLEQLCEIIREDIAAQFLQCGILRWYIPEERIDKLNEIGLDIFDLLATNKLNLLEATFILKASLASMEGVFLEKGIEKGKAVEP